MTLYLSDLDFIRKNKLLKTYTYKDSSCRIRSGIQEVVISIRQSHFFLKFPIKIPT